MKMCHEMEPYDGFVAEGRMKVALFFLFHKVDVVHIATHLKHSDYRADGMYYFFFFRLHQIRSLLF